MSMATRQLAAELIKVPGGENAAKGNQCGNGG